MTTHLHGRMTVSRDQQDGMLKYRDGSRIELYQTSFVGEFAFGAAELAGQPSGKWHKQVILDE